MEWIGHPLVLSGSKVSLQPLKPEHFPALIRAAQNTRIWEQYGRNGADISIMQTFLDDALALRIIQQHYPFTIINTISGEIIGTTRIAYIDYSNKTLEIGWTWYVPEVWGKGYNEECKLLLLTHCFEKLGAIRTQLKTRDTNLRSRNSIQRIGATFEGILRNHMLNEDGSIRNTAMFSITQEEWPVRKEKLKDMMNEKYARL
ncbi:MAG: GNAT family N-acetyltransferase [Chitinophagales bacterium]|nr:GNAT family N-acetyltransferase [Chitinophagales bacterium]